jgi:hypothetical protein
MVRTLFKHIVLNKIVSCFDCNECMIIHGDSWKWRGNGRSQLKILSWKLPVICEGEP